MQLWNGERKETRGDKRGGVKTTFPRGSFGKAALRKLPKLLTHIPALARTYARLTSAKSYEIHRHTLDGEMRGYVCTCVCVCVSRIYSNIQRAMETDRARRRRERNTGSAPPSPLVGWILPRPNPPMPALRIVCGGDTGRGSGKKTAGRIPSSHT